MISVIIMIVDQISFSVVFDTIGAFFNSVMKEKGAGLIILQVIVLAVVGLFDSILVFFAAMSIGQLMTKHKILGSVLAYIGIYFVGQIINTIILITIGSRGNMGTLDVVMSTTDATVTTQVMLLFVIIAQIVYGVVYYAVTYYFLSRRLNLE